MTNHFKTWDEFRTVALAAGVYLGDFITVPQHLAEENMRRNGKRFTEKNYEAFSESARGDIRSVVNGFLADPARPITPDEVMSMRPYWLWAWAAAEKCRPSFEG